MRFPRCLRLACLLTGALLLLGCSDKPAGMPNMIQGTGPYQQRDLKTKKSNKPLPEEPPSPKAPP
jgi:hypothetical protein